MYRNSNSNPEVEDTSKIILIVAAIIVACLFIFNSCTKVESVEENKLSTLPKTFIAKTIIESWYESPLSAKSSIDTTFNLSNWECVESGTPDEVNVWSNDTFDLLEKNGVVKFIERIHYSDIDSSVLFKTDFYYSN
jgi:hypothetical protein